MKANDAHLVHLLDGTASRRLSTPGQQLQYDYYFISDSGGAEVALNTTAGGVFEIDAPFQLASYQETSLYWLKLNLCKETKLELDNFKQCSC